MNNSQSYLLDNKVRFIRQCQQDVFEQFTVKVTPWTRKAFFYFVVYDGIKYVHKEALRFVYTTDEKKQKTCTAIPDFESFLSDYNGHLLPEKLAQTDKFWLYEYYEGSPLLTINTDDFWQLKKYHKECHITPFYNSMAYNLVRGARGVKLVDFKHFEEKDKPFFVYFYNEDANVNRLFIDAESDNSKTFEHLAVDYPVADAVVCKVRE